jgi:NifU-like protein involved in Fe-S cluster formation
MRDVMQLQIKVNTDGIIEKAVFKTFGCGSAIASSSFTTELLHGMHIDKTVSISNRDIASHLKLPVIKYHCSMLAEDSIKSAVENYKQKNKK